MEGDTRSRRSSATVRRASRLCPPVLGAITLLGAAARTDRMESATYENFSPCAFAVSAIRPCGLHLRGVRGRTVEKQTSRGTGPAGMAYCASQAPLRGGDSRQYVRLSEREDGFDLKTASISLCTPQGNQRIKLAATIHLGERSYFERLQGDLERNEKVLYELVVGDELAKVEGNMRRLRMPIGPSEAQQAFSRKYGLQHQLEVMRMDLDDWYIADLDPDEIGSLREQSIKELERQFVRGVQNAAWIPAATELSRDTMEQWYQSGGTVRPDTARRLPFYAAAVFLSFLPCPELSGIVISWLLRSSGQNPREALRILHALFRFALLQDFMAARRLVLAHDLVVGQQQPTVGLYQVVIAARNAKVLGSLLPLLAASPQRRLADDDEGYALRAKDLSADEAGDKILGRATGSGHGAGNAGGGGTREKSVGVASIGIMYGALHLDDLLRQMHATGLRVLQEDPADCTKAGGNPGSAGEADLKGSCKEGPGPTGDEGVGWNVAWSMRNSHFNDLRVLLGTTAAGVSLLLLGVLDWLDQVSNILNAADCIRYGVKETIFSQWPGTDIVIPVTALVQCPDEDAVVSDIVMKQVLPYAFRHAWQFWVFRSLLFSIEG